MINGLTARMTAWDCCTNPAAESTTAAPVSSARRWAFSLWILYNMSCFPSIRPDRTSPIAMARPIFPVPIMPIVSNIGYPSPIQQTITAQCQLHRRPPLPWLPDRQSSFWIQSRRPGGYLFSAEQGKYVLFQGRHIPYPNQSWE